MKRDRLMNCGRRRRRRNLCRTLLCLCGSFSLILSIHDLRFGIARAFVVVLILLSLPPLFLDLPVILSLAGGLIGICDVPTVLLICSDEGCLPFSLCSLVSSALYKLWWPDVMTMLWIGVRAEAVRLVA